MIIPSLLILAIALVAVYIHTHVAEELVQVGATIIALLCLVLNLILAPLAIKFIIVGAILLTAKRTSLALFNSLLQ
ncbi:hypothetical protein [Coleofasciculus sp.]|uniref:hypothetical protein n=1 Tax=Coleofasciculus sp. TaxID=3100458 RepID=UPI0039FAE930